MIVFYLKQSEVNYKKVFVLDMFERMDVKVRLVDV